METEFDCRQKKGRWPDLVADKTQFYHVFYSNMMARAEYLYTEDNTGLA